MRVAILSLLAASALTATMAVSAFAQEPTPALTPAPMPAPAAPEVAPAPAPQALPVAPAPVAAPEPPPPPPPPPAAPTEATSVLFNDVLNRVCKPLVRGGDISKLAPQLGLKLKKRDNVWEKTWAQGMKVTLRDPGVNKNVCTVTIQHPIDGLTATITDIHNKAIYDGWTLEDNAKRTADLERTNRKWSHFEGSAREDVVLMTVRKVGGAPLNSKYDQTDLIYAITTF